MRTMGSSSRSFDLHHYYVLGQEKEFPLCDFN